jgi:SAM-dependent methyltransferase
VFLDADDRLLPDALEAGLRCLQAHPECAFVAGHCRYIALDGAPLPTPKQTCVERDHYLALLRGCYIWMPATVIYQRAVFAFLTGFDTAVHACADYDLYLRIARTFPVCCHDQVVAEYRQHGANMTLNAALMLASTLTVLHTQWRYVKGNQQFRAAYKSGLKLGQEYYGAQVVEEVRSHILASEWSAMLRGIWVLLRYYPRGFFPVLRTGFLKLTRRRDTSAFLLKDYTVQHQTGDPFLKLYVCPVCKGGLRFTPTVISCVSCGLQFFQSRSDCLDLLPHHLFANEESHWGARQQEMEDWYKALIADPTEAYDIFVTDYTPYAPLLARMSGTILDLGGGIGIVRHYLPHDVRYIVIDPSLAWLETKWVSLAEHFPCLKTRPCFVRGIGEYLPFPEHAFDVVLAFWSLNHVSDPERVFREVYRVLRAGGRFLVIFEDMMPTDRDIADQLLLAGRISAVNGEPISDKPSLRLQEWSLQSDHIRIQESDIRRWISGRFTVMWRRWMNQYLTFEFCKD